MFSFSWLWWVMLNWHLQNRKELVCSAKMSKKQWKVCIPLLTAQPAMITFSCFMRQLKCLWPFTPRHLRAGPSPVPLPFESQWWYVQHWGWWDWPGRLREAGRLWPDTDVILRVGCNNAMIRQDLSFPGQRPCGPFLLPAGQEQSIFFFFFLGTEYFYFSPVKRVLPIAACAWSLALPPKFSFKPPQVRSVTVHL